MSYTINTKRDQVVSIQDGNISIPIASANSDYQAVLDAIIKQGADCFDGDIPAELQAAADEKQFNQQLAAYRTATARLAQYIVAEGRVEVREMQPTGEQVFNEETGEMEDVMHEVITVTAIEPVEATVERIVYADDPTVDAEPTIETIENPLITKDNEERAAAQAVVDATPQAVIDAA